MTLTVAWWAWPILFIIAGAVTAYMVTRSRYAGGDYDFFTPLFAAAAFLAGVLTAIAFTLGHYLA